MYGSITSVDGLFMSLILLAMSGIVGLNVSARTVNGTRRHKRFRGSKTSSSGASLDGPRTAPQRGRIESVQFY